jgi:glyoxylase-like metal-dependent hydrolase (beta-lactamase superfamily II)
VFDCPSRTRAQYMESLGAGVWAIDTGFQRARFDAAYLVAEAGEAAFIDTGPNLAVPRLLQALDDARLAREEVKWVILTHVHLDHAGGAGLLMESLPNAHLLVHPRGARHIADPSTLLAGVQAVYGAEIAARDYGEPKAVPVQRIVHAVDDMVISVGRRPLRVAETPGHAHHHVCVWDQSSRGWFSGDTLGVSYPEFVFDRVRYAIPSTTPTQFDPAALCRSIERLMSFQPSVAYITHYGAILDVAAQATQVIGQAHSMTAIALAAASQSEPAQYLRHELEGLYRTGLAQAYGHAEVREYLDLLAGDIELNAQGLETWVCAQRGAGGGGSPSEKGVR